MATLTGDELRVLIHDLQAAWDDYGDAEVLHQPAARRNRPFTGEDAQRVGVVHGWVRHLHETGKAAVLLLNNGLVNAELPLVRQMFELALTSVWVMQSEDQHGVRAVVLEHSRNRAAFAREARLAQSPTFQQSADEIVDTDSGHIPGTFDSVQRFREICLDLTPAGHDAYVIYRVLSTSSHPSVSVSDLYFDAPATPAERLPARRLLATAAIPADTLLYFVAVTLVWGARAYVYTSQDKMHRSLLRSAARVLLVTSEIKLSEHYRRRHAKRRKDG